MTNLPFIESPFCWPHQKIVVQVRNLIDQTFMCSERDPVMYKDLPAVLFWYWYRMYMGWWLMRFARRWTRFDTGSDMGFKYDTKIFNICLQNYIKLGRVVPHVKNNGKSFSNNGYMQKSTSLIFLSPRWVVYSTPFQIYHYYNGYGKSQCVEFFNFFWDSFKLPWL